MDPLLEKALKDTRAEDCINSASEKYLLRSISNKLSDSYKQENIERLLRLGYLYELEGFRKYVQLIVKGSAKPMNATSGQNPISQVQIRKEQISPMFKQAFSCWRALTNLNGEDGRISDETLQLMAEEFICGDIPAYHSLALHLSVCGILAQRTAEVRLELKNFIFNGEDEDNWSQLLIKYIIESFVLITRKDNGWLDIDEALSRISLLRDLQKEKEEKYIEAHEGNEKQVQEAIKLVGIYHLAQVINLTAEYLQTGLPGYTALNISLDRHHERAITAFKTSNEYLMQHMADLLWIGCREILQNSIWTHTAPLPTSIRKFVVLLSDRGRPKPIIELWPAQQEALYRNLLTTYHRAILVEMPTSAGKTLLAKFTIVQTKALVPDGTIAYIVPTRALANQVTFDLRSDFKGLKPPIRVEMTVPAYELDPIENSLLQNPPDVLVTTPEKLDLLIRKEHPSVKNISLIIADEAHNIQEGGRGPRLELLLGILKRERPEARFLLLSPFMPNADDILSWLGEGMELPAIDVDWKPGNRVVGALNLKGRSSKRQFLFETLPAADNSDIKGRWELSLASGSNVPSSRTISNLTIGTVKALKGRNSILILCKGKGTATKRAREIADILENIRETPELRAICDYLEAESGVKTPLTYCLKKGVAYHHAGISHEARWLIEQLIKNGTVSVICGTTTLAQGVNFPISTVIVETLKKGTDNDLSYEDFWNIAGRAGRTLIDSVGIIGFPINDTEKQKSVEKFLEGEADEIASQLASLIDSADKIGNRFDLVAIARNPHLSELLQFLAHTMRVAGRTDLADEVEDIMRASLVYHQVRKRGDDTADKLLLLCRRYLLDLSKKQNLPGLLAQADVAGFSTPSILSIRHKLADREYSGLKKVEFWEPNKLFDYKSKNLTRSIELVGEIPEIRLGYRNVPPFDPERVADVIKYWVNGLPLEEISNKYPMGPDTKPDERLAEFSKYLFELIGKVSWGVGALEGLSLSHITDEDREKTGYIPSMIFFGVKSKEAVWLRMVGVPRILADGLAKIWLEKNSSPPTSYDEIRSWVNSLTDYDWAEAIPANASLNPEQCRYIWDTLKG